MAVVPSCSILHCSEPVGKFIARGNWALGNGVDPVHFQAFQLSNAMPMDRRSVEVQMIFHRDLYDLSICALKKGSFPFITYQWYRPSTPLTGQGQRHEIYM